ncbi:metallophosphoesterase family protein [Roseovarius sp.]|uniref:metallophosphoesterase family protein n=1 Tax=Roseovarius sp. TaxID=1486281 RepID=UPI00356B324E
MAIGDIHGRVDLLRELDGLIEAQCSGWPVVFLGDYIDRGEQSREVLELLMSVSAESTPSVTCLMGNHERMLLEFLNDPAAYGPRWLRNGGLQALASFGVAMPRGDSKDPAVFENLRDRLSDAMGDRAIAWLRTLPLTWRSGNVWAVHAGADPALPMIEQTEDVLLWGHSAFRKTLRTDGQWVVHGHTIVDAAQIEGGRIALDTGAYATGRLSAAGISADGVDFMRTGAT